MEELAKVTAPVSRYPVLEKKLKEAFQEVPFDSDEGRRCLMMLQALQVPQVSAHPSSSSSSFKPTMVKTPTRPRNSGIPEAKLGQLPGEAIDFHGGENVTTTQIWEYIAAQGKGFLLSQGSELFQIRRFLDKNKGRTWAYHADHDSWSRIKK